MTIKATLRGGWLPCVLSIADVRAQGRGSAFFATEADARAFHASLPKYVKARCRCLSRSSGSKYDTEFGLVWQDDQVWFVDIYCKAPDGTTGVTNESGLRRLNAFCAALEQLDVVSYLVGDSVA